MNIRSELIIFFLIISVIPLSSVVYVSYEHSKEAISDSVMANLLGATENTGNAIDNWMDARKDDIRVISQSRIVVNMEKERLHDFLKTFKEEHKGVYREFFILDPDGNVLFSTTDRTGNEGKIPYFTEALKGKIYISDVNLHEATGSPELTMTNPIRKNGTITGILAARVSLENLYRIIENIDTGESGEIFIVNKDGNIIFHENRSVILFDNIKNNLAVREVTYEKNGINEYINYRGEKVLGSYFWLPLYRWGLVVEENTDEAFAGVLALGRLMISISILAVIGVVLLAVIFSKKITEPIKSLEEGAVDLVKGQFKTIPVSSRNEIGRLTKIFNGTAKELLDIREKLETKIEIANKDLEKKNKELTDANKQLKELDQLKSDFISFVSHELKTPLSAIKLSAEYLESENDIDTGTQKDMLDIIIRNTDRQTRMINDILDLSKIEAGKMELQFGEVDIREIAKMVFENLKQMSLKKNVSLSLELPEKLPEVIADREKLIIVFNNLLENALKFTPDGGNISLSGKEDVDSIEVSISDTGIGIEKEKLEKIFDKFYQVDSKTRKSIGGGLGLSISSGIIKAHGSEIHIESIPGKGSIFSFRLKKGGS